MFHRAFSAAVILLKSGSSGVGHGVSGSEAARQIIALRPL
jgi:hypothetical protein